MLFWETITVYYENHMEHTNTLCGQNAEFYYVKSGGTFTATGLKRANTYHVSLKD
jgi:hypothetical protein